MFTLRRLTLSRPVLEYMAYCGDTCQGVPSASLDWFKISEEGWTGTDWVSNDITHRPGHDRSFTIPADLGPGLVLYFVWGLIHVTDEQCLPGPTCDPRSPPTW